MSPSLPRYSADDLDLNAYSTQVAWLVADVAHDLPLDDAIDFALADREEFEIERDAGMPLGDAAHKALNLLELHTVDLDGAYIAGADLSG
ncbi:hypothetical protein H4J02_06540 [Protaetiibacter sp. SSC-01]|uniref:hypothetical protein n=1 Tax=Protaetiibacter sp. SSC-01 TaxID=2759943 RepID=UPI001656D7BA|nr:hypothetical protein [Protaetiibacter sp. SSC-01]QNO38644.1 hypothetical protein H4J02_06540 [Protaetiibacter sp. SSC-01]